MNEKVTPKLNEDDSESHSATKKYEQKKQEEQDQGRNLEEAFADYQQILVFLVAGWIISLILVKQDSSQCLDLRFQGLDFTFRTWLWVNFGLSISLMGFFLMTVMMAAVIYMKEISSTEQTIVTIATSIACLGCMTMIMKVIWIFAGAVIFLYHLPFQKCSERLILYCSAQFLVFLSVFGFLLAKWLFKLAVEIFFACYSPDDKDNRNQKKQKELEQKEKELDQTQKDFDLEALVQETGARLKKRIAFWGMVGWIYAFALAKKDTAQCLDQKFGVVQITYRQWLYGDGATTLIVTVIFLILAFRILGKGKEYKAKRFIYEEQQEEEQRKPLFDQLLALQWIKQHTIIGVIFIVAALFKTAWLCLGFFMFMVNLKVEKCGKGIVADYLLVYFVQLGYLGMIVFSILIVIIAKYCKQKGTTQQRPNESDKDESVVKNDKNESAVKNHKNDSPQLDESSNKIFIQASQIKDFNSSFNVAQIQH